MVWAISQGTNSARGRAGFSSAGFSLCAFLLVRQKSKPHRLKPALPGIASLGTLFEIQFGGQFFEAANVKIGFKFPWIKNFLGIAVHPHGPQSASLRANHVKWIAGNQADHFFLGVRLGRQIFVHRRIRLERADRVYADNSSEFREYSCAIEQSAYSMFSSIRARHYLEFTRFQFI